jgi:Ran GTPase-activating protein (RanGAP) involved in mRNA processing and transport
MSSHSLAHTKSFLCAPNKFEKRKKHGEATEQTRISIKDVKMYTNGVEYATQTSLRIEYEKKREVCR